MVRSNTVTSPEQLALLRWTVRLGAVTADALAVHAGSTLASARGRLHGAESKGLVCSQRLLAGRPALYTATRSGLRAAGLHGFEPCRVSVANAPHAIECARVAAALEHAYPDHHVMGERELRRDEREAGDTARQRAARARPRRHAAAASPGPRAVAAGRRLRRAPARGGRGRADGQGSAPPARDLPRVGALSLRRGHALPRRPRRREHRSHARSRRRRRGGADRDGAARRARPLARAMSCGPPRVPSPRMP